MSNSTKGKTVRKPRPDLADAEGADRVHLLLLDFLDELSIVGVVALIHRKPVPVGNVDDAGVGGMISGRGGPAVICTSMPRYFSSIQPAGVYIVPSHCCG